MCAAPLSPGEEASPTPSAAALADRPAAPADRQPIPNSSRGITDQVFDFIGEPRGREFHLDEPVWKGCARRWGVPYLHKLQAG
jgi:hypothetical protein